MTGGDLGRVYSVSPAGNLSGLGSAVGPYAKGGLLQGADGSFYGTVAGGNSALGYIFKMTPSGQTSTLYQFTDGADGTYPSEGLIDGGDGNYYGAAGLGNGQRLGYFGTLFKITPNGVFTILHTFTGGSDGSLVYGLVRGRDGNFYGLTGGQYGVPSTLFQMTPSGSMKTIFTFESIPGFPVNLIIASDGSFYGIVGNNRFDGSPSQISVFRISPDGTGSTICTFEGQAGSNHFAPPRLGCLTEGSDGNLYGTSYYGGISDQGLLFRVTPDASFTVLHNFSGTDGANPAAPLIQGSDGRYYGITHSGGAGGHGTVFSLVPADSSLLLSIHSVPPEAIVNVPGGIDEPLALLPSGAILKSKRPPLLGGLVADGVTPLLIELDSSVPLSQITTFHFSLAVTGGVVNGGLEQYLHTLQEQTGFIVGDNVDLSPSHSSGFAYISGIRSEDIQMAAGSKELTVTLSATKTGDSTSTATVRFRIRKPPVVLLHGFNSDNGTWYKDTDQKVPNDFIASLQKVFPADFILPIEYGVSRQNGHVDDSINRAGPFHYLASLLDKELTSRIENAVTVWRQQWAFTRYNVVGHSQAGILARMLCTSDNPSSGLDPGFRPFRSTNNLFRGRFHEVITINSPHNGSTGVRYLIDGRNRGFVVPALLGPILQDKFDPFGPQLEDINVNHWQIDSGAKFHLVGTTIYGGKSPGIDSGLFPLCYGLTGLFDRVPGQGYSVGNVVFPAGSDGVVDFKSQFAGLSTSSRSIITGVDISHSLPTGGLFGVAAGNTATASSIVGDEVANLLDGSRGNFSSFDLAPIDPTLKVQIDGVTSLGLSFNIISAGSSTAHPFQGLQGVNSSYQFFASPPQDHVPASALEWHAEIFGPNGITDEGVSATPDNQNSVTVAVDDGVIGQVILYVSYRDDSDNMIFGNPIVVVTKAPGNNITRIELIPESINLPLGSTIKSEVWADYDNGARSRLFVQSGVYSSQNSSVATVDPEGNVALQSPGTTQIDLSYFGLSAHSTVVVSTPAPPPRPNVNISTGVSPSAAGTVSGDGSYQTGVAASVSAVPAECFNFVSWTENGSIVSTSANYQFITDSDRLLTANFAIASFAVVATASPAIGGTVTGGANYDCGSSVTVSANAQPGYAFVNWTQNGSIVSTSPTYTFTVTSSQTPLVANFVVSYSVTVSASPSNGGSVTGGGNFNDGSNVTVTATPNTGFAFVNWTQNGTGVSTLASYTFTLIANRTLVANFLPSVGTPTISPNGGTYKKKVTLTMSCATAGALIYYTTDGTAPTATSSVYPTAVGKKKPKGISIAGKGSHIVKAKGVKNGSADSAITTATFTIN